MRETMLVAQIITSVALTGLVLLQVKGTGFGRVWGGLSTHSSKRGLEGLVFKATFFVAFLFIALSISTLLVS